MAAFDKAPTNPYTAKAEEFRQNLAAEAPAQEPGPQNSIYPQFGAQEPSPASAPAPEPAPAPQPEQVQIAPPSQPQPAPAPQYPPAGGYDPMLAERLAAEREQFRQAYGAQAKELDELRAKAAELDDIKRRASVRADVQQKMLDGLSSVTPEDAQAISESVLTMADQRLDPLKQQLEQQRREFEEATARQRAELERSRREMLNGRILAAHPDFYQIMNTPEYRQYVTQRDGKSSETRDVRAAREYLNGNTDYVVDMISQFKASRAGAARPDAVPPAQVAPGGVPAQGAPQKAPLTLRDLNNLFQTRQISPDEYMRMLPEVRKAQMAQLSGGLQGV